MKTPAPRKGFKQRSAQNRSRITNNGDQLPGVDGRSAAARRYRDIAGQIVADQGGAERIAEARLQLIRRFSAAAVLAELLEADMARGVKIDISEHAQLTSSMVRVAHRIGINRRMKDVVPSLSQYLEAKQQTEDDG